MAAIDFNGSVTVEKSNGSPQLHSLVHVESSRPALKTLQARSGFVVLLLLVWGGFSSLSLPAQTKIKPGFNLFSLEEDIAVGRQSAQLVEQQMPILYKPSIQRYLDEVGNRLVAVVPGPDFPYQFKVVDVPQINAFALPGGFMFVNRGLIERVENEAQLAGVLAHEMAHVALRHGTNHIYGLRH